MVEIRLSQAAFITVTTPPLSDIRISQVAFISVVPNLKIAQTIPATKLPCQSPCLQFFDARKRG